MGGYVLSFQPDFLDHFEFLLKPGSLISLFARFAEALVVSSCVLINFFGCRDVRGEFAVVTCWWFFVPKGGVAYKIKLVRGVFSFDGIRQGSGCYWASGLKALRPGPFGLVSSIL